MFATLAAVTFLTVTTARAAPGAVEAAAPIEEEDDDRTAPSPSSVGIDEEDDEAAEASLIGAPLAWERGAPCECDRDALARAFAAAPALGAVIDAARGAAGVARDPTSSWRTRSRLSALVPAVTLRIGNSESWRDVTDPTVSYANAAGATLSWRLDQLVFDHHEPRLEAYDLARRRVRRQIAHLTSRAYFAWIAARAAAEHDARWQLELHRRRASLDALTDGWFSASLGHAR